MNYYTIDNGTETWTKNPKVTLQQHCTVPVTSLFYLHPFSFLIKKNPVLLIVQAIKM